MTWKRGETTVYPWLLQTNMTIATVNTTPAKDVLIDGCLSNFNTIACIRSSILTFLAVLTGVLCVLKLIRLHNAHHQNWHQYFIFYCASLECTVAAIHFVLYVYVQFDFVLQWLKLAQFLVMCHFYWTLATRALRREVWTKRFLIPFLSIASVYFTTVAVLGIVKVQDTFVECFQPYWIMMSSAEFLIVQLFCVAGFYITRRLNEISTLDSVRRSQKRDLWCIVVVFEVSALVGVLYDMTLRIIGDKENGCSAIFKHAQELFSVIFFSFMVIKLLLPIWVMLFVFQPTPQVTAEPDDLIPALTDDGNSAFSTNTDEQYRQLYHPAENYRSLSYDSPTNSPVSGYGPMGPAGSINTVVVNGVGNNSYKTVALPNNSLGTIREEPAAGSRSSSVRNRGAASHQSSISRSQQGKTGIVKDQQTVHLEPRESQMRSQGDYTQKNASRPQVKPYLDMDENNQSKSSQSKTPDVSHPIAANQNIPISKRDGPTFSIAGTSEDSDSSPPQKGTFYI